MKPTLVIGLGNPLMGDDGVGLRATASLAVDSRLPDTVDVIGGGTDLLNHAQDMMGRDRVIVIDAADDGEPPGSIHIWQRNLPPAPRGQHAHHLSAVEEIGLLQLAVNAPFVLVTVSIATAAAGEGLSPPVESCLPSVVRRVLETAAGELAASISDTTVL